MYTEYCNAVGGKAHDGSPLPTWSEFRNDATKQKQVQAWIAAAEAALSECRERIKSEIVPADFCEGEYVAAERKGLRLAIESLNSF